MLITLLILAAAVVGAVCWGVATRWPVMAWLSFTLAFMLAIFAFLLGAIVMIELQTHGMLVGASPLITIGIPGACGLLGYASYRIYEIATAKPASEP